MAEASTPSPKTPWHLWLVGILSLLWNAVGAMNFTVTLLKVEAFFKDCTPEQKAYFFGFPAWAMIAWGVATWGSELGSLLLLLRRKAAVSINLIVLIAMVPTFTYNYILTDGLKIMAGGSKGPLVLTAVIVVIGVLLFVYARAMAKRGVLR